MGDEEIGWVFMGIVVFLVVLLITILTTGKDKNV